MTLQTTLLSGQRPLKATLFLRLLERLQTGSLRLTLPDGEVLDFDADARGPQAQLQLRDWRAVGKILSGGDIGVAEAYRDGWIDSPDMLQVLLLALATNRRWTGPCTAALEGRCCTGCDTG